MLFVNKKLIEKNFELAISIITVSVSFNKKAVSNS